MSDERFSRRDVLRSFRKFRDTYSDMLAADWRTWPNNLEILVDHCESDPVMRAVTERLRANPNVNIDKWLEESFQSAGGWGNARFKLPTNDDDRTSLLYQFLGKIRSKELKVDQFCRSFFGENGYQAGTQILNREFVTKFARQVQYRLQEIEEDIGNADEVPRESLQAMHVYHGPVQQFRDVSGSNIAIGVSKIDHASASYSQASPVDVSQELDSLKSYLEDVAVEQRQRIEDAIGLMIRAIEDGTVSTSQVVDAAETVASGSSRLKSALAKIGEKAGDAVIGKVIDLALKSTGFGS